MKTLFKILIINIFVLISFLLIFEALFGNWIFDYKYLRNLPNEGVTRYDIDGLYSYNQKYIIYSRDQFGIRGNYSNINELDIVTMGGSTTDQRYIDDDDTWQEKLRKNFKEKGLELNIINMGVDGQSTVGHIDNFEYWIDKIENFNSKYILYYIGLNDLLIENQKGYDDFVKNYEFVNNFPFIKKVQVSIKKNSVSYFLFKLIRGSLITVINKRGHGKVDFSTIEWTNEGLIDFDIRKKIMAPRLNDYYQRLKKLKEKTNNINSKMVIVTQKSMAYKNIENEIFGIKDPMGKIENLDYNGVDFYYFLSEITKTTLDFCISENVLCLNFFSEDLLNEEHFYDMMHTNNLGSSVIANYLFENLVDEFK